MQIMTSSSFPVVARSPCDEAIHLSPSTAMDCFAEPVISTRALCARRGAALCADPLARNDDGDRLRTIRMGSRAGRSLALDAHGKSLSSALLALDIEGDIKP